MQNGTQNEFVQLCHNVSDRHRDWDTFIHPLIRSYYTKAHKHTNITSFSFELSYISCGPGMFDDGSTSSLDMFYPTGLMPISEQLLACNIVLHAQTKTRPTSIEFQYHRDFEMKVDEILAHSPGQLVYIDKPPRVFFAWADTGLTAGATYVKRIMRTTGPHAFVIANDDTLSIIKNRIRCKVSIQYVTIGPTSTRYYNETPYDHFSSSQTFPKSLSQRKPKTL